MDGNRRMLVKYGFGLALVLAGLALGMSGTGQRPFAGFDSLGTWLVYAGLVTIAATTLHIVLRKERQVDERMEFAASKAMRVTFLLFIAAAFVLMVMDGVSPIAVPVHMLMAYLICGMMAAYFLSYRVILAHH